MVVIVGVLVVEFFICVRVRKDAFAHLEANSQMSRLLCIVLPFAHLLKPQEVSGGAPPRKEMWIYS